MEWATQWSLALLWYLQRAGNELEADALYRTLVEECRALPVLPDRYVDAHTWLAHFAAARQDVDTMERCRRVIEPYEHLLMNHAGTVGRALGVMAAAEGRWDDAVGTWGGPKRSARRRVWWWNWRTAAWRWRMR